MARVTLESWVQTKYQMPVLKKIDEWLSHGLKPIKIAKMTGFNISTICRNLEKAAIQKESVIKSAQEKAELYKRILSKPWSTWTCKSEKMDLQTTNTKQS